MYIMQMLLAAISPVFNLFSSSLNHPSFSILFSSFWEATHVVQAATQGAMQFGNGNLQRSARRGQRDVANSKKIALFTISATNMSIEIMEIEGRSGFVLK